MPIQHFSLLVPCGCALGPRVLGINMIFVATVTRADRECEPWTLAQRGALASVPCFHQAFPQRIDPVTKTSVHEKIVHGGTESGLVRVGVFAICDVPIAGPCSGSHHESFWNLSNVIRRSRTKGPHIFSENSFGFSVSQRTVSKFNG